MSDLFSDPVTDAPTIDETKDYLSEFVGEGKKFADVKALAKSKAFADAHIGTLTKALEAMRTELSTRKTAEDLINQIALANTKVDSNREQNQTATEQNTDQNNKPSLTPEDVEKMFQEREQRRQKETNLNLTTQKLKETFGDKAATELSNKARELGVDTSYMKKLAEDTPSVFLSLFSKPQVKSNDIFNAPPANQFRVAERSNSGEKWSDFNKVKTSDPKKYWSPGFQRQLMDAAERAENQGRYEEFIKS